MAATQVNGQAAPEAPSSSSSWLASWWVIGGAALLLLLVLGWGLLLHPTWTAPTRDPAWYTWRSNVILQADPGSIAREWGPGSVFSGGYRVSVPLAGALLQRVAGISQYSFSAFLMVGIPVLAGMALGVGAFRERKDALAMILTMLASAALFLTTPYVGYLDNITVLFLLSLIVGFSTAARTSWGARTAIFLIATAVAFTHPTTAVLFGLTLMAVFGFHFLSSHFSLGAALKADGPLLMSTGFGMIFGLSFWVVGVWGPTAKFADAALPPPYTKQFFVERLTGWITSLQPLITVPLILVAVGSSILWSRRTKRPVGEYTVLSTWWMFPFLGILTALTGTQYQHAGDPGSSVVPYYRFMNATAAPIALVGLGAFVAVRFFLRWGRQRAEGRAASGGAGLKRVVAAVAAIAVVGSLAWVLVDGLNHRWVSEQGQWIDEPARTSLAAVHVVADAAGERPNILVMNYNDQDDSTQSNTAYGWAKTFTNVFRTGLPGASAQYAATYMGTVDNFLAGQPTTSASTGYTTWAKKYFNDVEAQRKAYPADPVVFLVGQFYKGNVDLKSATADAIQVGPDVWVLQGDGLWTPPDATVQEAQAAAAAQQASFDDHPGPLGNPLHTLRVLAGLFVLAVLPGLLAAPFFELDDTPSRMALVPGMSIVMSLLAGIAVLAVWRGPLTSAKGWTVVLVAVGLGAVLRVARKPVTGVLLSFGNFFNKLFSAFSNRDFAVLMGVQFLAQAGQGVIQGAIGKSIAFGGEKGFDVSTVPSADYLLKVVLALYVPYTLISPFIGVFIDRFARRKVVAWTNVIVAAIVTGVAVLVMLPLGKATSEGNVVATAGLILALLAAQGCVRVVLAVKSAAIPDVLVGKDLLQGNGLSQAGGALFQVFGIAFALGAGAVLPAWLVVVGGAAVLLVAMFIARQMRHAEAHAHDTTFAQEASRVIHNVVAGIKEVAERKPAALGLTSFQMLRYQFWGFGLFTFALYAKNLVQGGDASNLALAISGGGGMVGGAIGLVLAQKLKDKVPPIRLLLVSMFLLGAGTLVFGAFVSLPGFTAMLFVGFFSFFLGKISADTIMQQSMPDDFRGRAFALFDIAYNLGFIIPAIILSFIWIENDPTRTRWILIISGAVFLGLTALVAAWARRIRDQFAPQDDLIEIEGGQAVTAGEA